MNLKGELEKIIEGDVLDDAKTLDIYAKDASIFRVQPKAVVFPKNTKDVMTLIKFVNEHKKEFPELSLTARSAGTDMTGGPLNESIIVCFTTYFKKEEVNEEALTAIVEPGVFYREFEKITLPEHISMPAYPASKSIAALGGMIMNNSAGERSLRYGQIRNFVDEVSMVLADGNEYTFGKLRLPELEDKKKLATFEGEVYRNICNLLEKNYDLIQKMKPKVSKNSAGYALWDVWDRKIFNMTQLFVGSQGTLGMLTRAKLRLIHDKPEKRLIVLFFKDWDLLPDVVNVILPYEPDSLEAFDNETLKLGIRFMPEIAKKVGEPLVSFALKFLPEVLIGIKMMGFPKLIMLVELIEDSDEALNEKTKRIKEAIKDFDVYSRIAHDEDDAEKYWIMRRESFNLLRNHVRGKKAVPFVEDFCITPEKIPEFLPKMLAVLKMYGIKANIAGHAGNGNFHIIPLMDLTKEEERAKIPVVADKIYDLIIEYGGTITAEHNDGIIRTPYLKKMFGNEMHELFREVKQIFDPRNIFNPGKKVGGTIEYAKEHIDVA